MQFLPSQMTPDGVDCKDTWLRWRAVPDLVYRLEGWHGFLSFFGPGE